MAGTLDIGQYFGLIAGGVVLRQSHKHASEHRLTALNFTRLTGSDRVTATNMRQPIIERFQITGRGLVVVVETPVQARSGQKLRAKVINPDGHEFVVDASIEMLLRRAEPVNEHEAYFLQGSSRNAKIPTPFDSLTVFRCRQVF